MLPRFVTEEEVSQIRIERSRLHSVLAGTLAAKGDRNGVQRHINEAWIAIAHLPESEEFIARSVVDLRRAYCKLRQLLGVPILHEYTRPIMQGCGKKKLKQLVPPQKRAGSFERVVALLADVQLNLDQIEARMTRNRKSLWWWMTLRRYQMVWLQYRELVRLWKRLNPALRDVNETTASLNYATDQEGETARALLLETIRRVSFDVFQLARIIHAALNIARISLTQNGAAKDSAQFELQCFLKQRWYVCLKQAARRLEHIRQEREHKKDAEWVLSPDVKSYVELVTRQTDAFLKSCRR